MQLHRVCQLLFWSYKCFLRNAQFITVSGIVIVPLLSMGFVAPVHSKYKSIKFN